MKVLLAGLVLLTFIAQRDAAPHVSLGKIIRVSDFKSKLVDSRNIDIWLPPKYNPKIKYRVVYMHDGQMLFDSTITWNKQEWRVDEVFSELIERNKVPPCIVVGIWNNGSFRHSEYFPQDILNGIPDSIRNQILANNLMGKPQANNYLRFITEELKPYIDKNFSTSTHAKHTYVMGSSMGGIISLYALCKYPEVFGAAACLSTHWPLMAHKNSRMSHLVSEAFRNYLETNLPAPGNHKIYFDHGNKTLDSLYKPHQQLVDKLIAGKGFNGSNWKTLEFDGHEHNEISWSQRLSIPIMFISN